MGLLDGLSKKLARATTENGEAKVLGRAFRYEMEGYFRKLELNYKAVVVDSATGVRGTAKNYLGRFTSLRYALIDMLTQLKDKGVIDKNVDVQSTAAATADCLDNPFTCYHEADSAPPDNSAPPAPPPILQPAPHSATSQQISTDSTASTNPVAPSSGVTPLGSAQIVDPFIAPGSATLPAVSIGVVCIVMTTIIWYCRRRGVIGTRQQLPSQAHKKPSIDDIPSLVELHSFPSRRGITNIPEQIGVNYTSFGIALLDDHSGAVVDGIAHKNLKNPKQINTELLQRWRNGEGRKPVSWSTLAACLRETGHSVLADDIQHTLTH